MAAARDRIHRRRERQRRLLRPLGWAFIVIVVTSCLQGTPAPGLRGAGLTVTAVLAGYVMAVAATIGTGWAVPDLLPQVALVGLMAGCAVALAWLQPHGPGEVAASMAVWLAAVRFPFAVAMPVATATAAGLAAATGATQQPALDSVVVATLLCLLLAITGQFIRQGRADQDRTELLLAELQDAQEAEVLAAALAERTRIAAELHDVLAHSLSGLAIQLQGARKLAEREALSTTLRATIDRCSELVRAGLADARQAVGALRGERLPTLDRIGDLLAEFRRDSGSDATLRIEGTVRGLPPEAGLALYRGVQEALTNVRRHAPGASVVVTVTYLRDLVRLTVEDVVPSAGTDAPGGEAGHDVGNVGGGYGLSAMRERVERVMGRADAGPTGHGWLVQLEVPV